MEENNKNPTDLSGVLEALKNSDVVLDKEFWDEQNRIISKQLEKFTEENRKMLPKNLTDRIWR